MNGGYDNLKENSQQKTDTSSTIENIIRWYEQNDLYQHYQRLVSQKIAGDGFKQCFLRENPSSIYFLAQLIEEVTGERTAAPAVYKLLSEKQRKRVVNIQPAITDLNYQPCSFEEGVKLQIQTLK